MIEKAGGPEEPLLAHLALVTAARQIGVRLPAGVTFHARIADVVFHGVAALAAVFPGASGCRPGAARWKASRAPHAASTREMRG